MGWWQVSADTLAGSRFVISPLAEATASLIALHSAAPAHPGEQAWLEAHLPAYTRRLASDPVTAQLTSAALHHRWIADFVTPPPDGAGEPSFADELGRVRQAPAGLALADLAVSAAGGPSAAAVPGCPGGRPDHALPAALRDLADAPQRIADLLEWVWTRTVLPTWTWRRAIMTADIADRTARLGRGGWAEALAGIRPGMRWLGDGRLQINTYDYPPRDICGAQLLFVPVTVMASRLGWSSWQLPERCAVVYPCSGQLAAAGRQAVPDPLAALLGPARARVLILLAAPKTTTQLVALTSQGLGSVGRHLRVLADAGLAGRRRSGRSVLYVRTAAGDTLAAASTTGRLPLLSAD